MNKWGKIARSKCSSPGLQSLGVESHGELGRPGRCPKSWSKDWKTGLWYLKMWENGPITLKLSSFLPLKLEFFGGMWDEHPFSRFLDVLGIRVSGYQDP